MSWIGNLGKSIFGSFLGNSVDYGQQWRYKQKEMALQQQYNERNMALQNEYAIDMWNRQNEYNDPSAVKQRYLDAGISPQAAMAGAASGAGIAGEIGTPSSEGPRASGIQAKQMALTLAQDMKIKDKHLDVLASEEEKNKSAADLNRANARKANADAAGQEFENSMQDLNRYLRGLDVRGKEAEIWKAEFLNKWAEIEKIQDVQKRNAEIAKLWQDQKESASRVGINEATIGKIDAEIAHLNSGTVANYAAAGASNATSRNLDARTKTEDAIRDYEVQLKAYQGEKISADTALARKHALEVDKRIEQIGKQMRLTEEQIKNAKNARARAWAEFGVRTLKDISQEARAWLLPFTDIDKKDESQNNFYSGYGMSTTY